MNNKYYAIKVGNNVKDIIVESWEECKKYTVNFPAIYKSFKTRKKARKYLESITDTQISMILRLNEKRRFNRLKQKIQEKYQFLIPDYIIDEMINRKNYDNLCALINLAILNNRLTKKEGIILKEGEKNYISDRKSVIALANGK